MPRVRAHGFAPIRDDRDFDEIDDGFDVETTIVLDDNKTYSSDLHRLRQGR